MPDHDRDQGAARADLCRLLAACYYQPGPEFAEENVFGSMREAATRIDPNLATSARRLGESFGAEDPEQLLVDYTRLFLGPTHVLAQPYGSVWLGAGQSLMQDSTVAVLELYREGGFEIDEAFRDLPDHIAAELEFLYLLLFREQEARRNGDVQALDAASVLRKRFLDEHVGAWVEPFANAVAAAAQTAYYRELAALTERFVRLEVDRSHAA